ncbi:hypothetical protein ABIB95_009593 [Bradyrhizobium sp. LA2.1]
MTKSRKKFDAAFKANVPGFIELSEQYNNMYAIGAKA